MRRHAERLLLAGACALLTVGCEQVTEPVVTESIEPGTPLFGPKIKPKKENCVDPENPACLPGPSPEDPNPNAPGYFIGPAYTMDNCKSIGISVDADNDGFDDKCELFLALRFAPLLTTNPGEIYLSRETFFAANDRPAGWFGTPVEHVEIFYLLGYHWDIGHPGDSEFIALRVEYNAITKHWELQGGFLSAHWNTVSNSSEDLLASQFSMPDKALGYPRVWVSKNKHANYRTKSKCNAGSILGSDTCNGNVDDERVEILLNGRNIGSSGSPNFANGVASATPLIYPGLEYFWTDGVDFCGWLGQQPGCAGGYEQSLF